MERARLMNRDKFIRMLRRLMGLSLAMTLGACALPQPTSIVQQPTSARPVAAAAAAPAANGAIFNAAGYRPLFEDRKARRVGDMLFITITEKTSAGKTAASNISKKSSAEASIPSIVKMLVKPLQGINVEASADNKSEDKADINSGNNFTGNLAVTVTEVLQNGYLVVAGEKQVGLDKGIEYVRFSGVVNPDMIQAGNRVASTHVADARLEYRTSTNIDAAEVTQWLARFFLSVLPL
jgi:flagellar L-ring protein precursor FlgH